MNTPEFLNGFVTDMIYYRNHPVPKPTEKTPLQKKFESYVRSKGCLVMDYLLFFGPNGFKYLKILEDLTEKYPEKQNKVLIWCEKESLYKAKGRSIYRWDIRGSYNHKRQIRHFEILREFLFDGYTKRLGCDGCDSTKRGASPTHSSTLPYHICTLCGRRLCQKCTFDSVSSRVGFWYIKCTCKDLYGDDYCSLF